MVDLFLSKSRSIEALSVADATVVSDQIVQALQVAAAIIGRADPGLDAPESE